MSEYVAGACNIGPSEIKQRKRVAYSGGVVFLAISIWLILIDAPTTGRLLVFFPAVAATTGLIQARKKFCVAFGFMGVFNFEKTGNVRKIKVNEDLKADKRYAVRLLLQSVLAAIALTVLVVLVQPIFANANSGIGLGDKVGVGKTRRFFFMVLSVTNLPR